MVGPVEVFKTCEKMFYIIWHDKTFCFCLTFNLGLCKPALSFIHYLCKRVGWQAASVWSHPNNSWGEKFRAQPAPQCVMGSFTLSAHGHDWLENSNCSPSPGQPYWTNILLSDLRSELACSSFPAAGRHQSGERFLASHNSPPDLCEDCCGKPLHQFHIFCWTKVHKASLVRKACKIFSCDRLMGSNIIMISAKGEQ